MERVAMVKPRQLALALAAIAAFCLLSACATDGTDRVHVSGSIYYGVGYYNPYYGYGPGYYPPVVVPPPRPPAKPRPPRPENPIQRSAPRSTPSIPSNPRPMRR